MVQLADAVNGLERWESGVALILHGKGGNFCAGADLSLARQHLVTGDDGRNMCALMTDTLTRLKRCVLRYGGACARWQHRFLFLPLCFLANVALQKRQPTVLMCDAS